MTVVSTAMTLSGIRPEFFKAFDGTKTYFQDLTTRIPSTTGKETHGFLGNVPQMREWGTGRVARGLFDEKFDVENLKYETTMEVDRDEISDDQTGAIMTRVREMAARAATHKDKLVSELLVNGATAGFNSYDGLTFFNAAHVTGESGSQSNILTPAAVDGDAPTTAEFRTAMAAGIARLLSLNDSQGEPMSMNAEGLIAIVPPAMYITALEALNATIVASTTNVLAQAAQVLAFPRLTDLSKFYLMKTDVPVRALIFQDREAIEFTALEGDSDEGFMREKYIYGLRARYRLTYGYWQYCLSLDFTTS